MLILALDSTAQVGSVALCEDEKLIAEYTLNTGHTHSETLLPMVESVLKISGYTVDDVDLFVCTAGPGSFTGVRIGAATVKGIAFGKDKPCIGVSTLEALALNGVALDGILCPCMNARRQQVYNALFDCDGSSLSRICEDRALAIAELGEELIEGPCISWAMGQALPMTPFPRSWATVWSCFPSGSSIRAGTIPLCAVSDSIERVSAPPILNWLPSICVPLRPSGCGWRS